MIFFLHLIYQFKKKYQKLLILLWWHHFNLKKFKDLKILKILYFNNLNNQRCFKNQNYIFRPLFILLIQSILDKKTFYSLSIIVNKKLANFSLVLKLNIIFILFLNYFIKYEKYFN